jgi:hypothetical protein
MMGLGSILGATLSNCGRQFLFAIAPIPAYGPQYFALCNSSNDPILKSPLKKISSPGYSGINESNGSHSDSQTIQSNHSKVTEAGFSSTSIILLLQSHIFRLQYFLGSALVNVLRKPGEKRADRVQWDLVMQSFVMIGIQLMLLKAVTRRRRMSRKQKVEDYDGSQSTERNYLLKSTSMKSSGISQKPFIWVYKPREYWRWDTVHQHVELILILTVLTYIFFRQYWYANKSALEYVNTVKDISVLLESCLAVPQMLLNYQRKSTQGLSKVMVLGWVLGDILKIAYFWIGSGELSELDGMEGEQNGDGGASTMTAFVLGSVFALIMDVMVWIQMVRWYPTPAMIEFKEKIRRRFYHFLSVDESSIHHVPPTRIKKRDLSGDFDL